MDQHIGQLILGARSQRLEKVRGSACCGDIFDVVHKAFHNCSSFVSLPHGGSLPFKTPLEINRSPLPEGTLGPLNILALRLAALRHLRRDYVLPAEYLCDAKPARCRMLFWRRWRKLV
jgi:hypothetical protein